MSAKLTAAQRTVLAYFATHRCGAMKLQGKWVWSSDIRRDPALATAFIKDRCDDAYPDERDIALIRSWMAADTGGRRQ